METNMGLNNWPTTYDTCRKNDHTQLYDAALESLAFKYCRHFMKPAITFSCHRTKKRMLALVGLNYFQQLVEGLFSGW